MRLIDAHKLYEQYETAMCKLVKSTNCENISLETLSLLCGANLIADAPTVDAIPIDKLCEWLTEIDMPLADACPLIDKYYHVCTQCDFFQRPIKECWKEILSKLMEEQNEVDRCG